MNVSSKILVKKSTLII